MWGGLPSHTRRGTQFGPETAPVQAAPCPLRQKPQGRLDAGGQPAGMGGRTLPCPPPTSQPGAAALCRRAGPTPPGRPLFTSHDPAWVDRQPVPSPHLSAWERPALSGKAGEEVNHLHKENPRNWPTVRSLGTPRFCRIWILSSGLIAKPLNEAFKGTDLEAMPWKRGCYQPS